MSHQTTSGDNNPLAEDGAQDTAASDPAPKPAAPPSQSSYIKDCAVLASSLSGPIIASGKALGPGLSKIQARVAIFRSPHHSSWLGFCLSFPLGERQQDDEESGFGVRYGYDRSSQSLVQLEQHRLNIKFPRDGCVFSLEEADAHVLARFPNAKGVQNGLTVFSVSVKEGARVTVEGFGVPYAHAQDPEIQGWINENQPIVDDVTLLDVLQSREFHFVIANVFEMSKKEFDERLLPPPFSYPYGTSHEWNLPLFKSLLEETKSPTQFTPAFNYDDDNSHLAVLTQANVQDVLWLDTEANEIASVMFSAYFVPVKPDDPDPQAYFVILPLTKEFRDSHDAAWRRLIKNEPYRLRLYSSAEDQAPAGQWDCGLVENPSSQTQLQAHPLNNYDLALYARRPWLKDERGHDFVVKTFQNRAGADIALSEGNRVALKFDAHLADCKRRVDAVYQFHPNAAPSAKDTSNAAEVASKMELHRALMRGKGFYEWMTGPRKDMYEASEVSQVRDRPAASVRPLPKVNLLELEDAKYADALVEEALPEDRARFRQYLSDRPLGLGMITAGAGFGKTTALATATLAMEARLGRILCTGPSNVSVDNFASRLDRVSASVCDRYNQGKQPEDESRARRKLVVRAFKPRDDIDAFFFLLANPASGDDISLSRSWGKTSKWQLQCSAAFWLLLVLRSQAEGIRELHPDDSRFLHDLRRQIDERPELDTLRAVASGELSFKEYQNGAVVHSDKITALLVAIASAADLLCTTPAMTVNDKTCRDWKENLVKGVAVDEAANMNRADLACVWGNTLLPCFLGGDPKQLPPTVMTTNDKDALGNFIHRLPDDGKISPLEFFQASGMPVYRLRVQLRMANGLFDAVAEEIYPEVPVKYAASCNINLPQFASGRALEAFVRIMFPDVKPSPEGKLSPVFVHCDGSRVFVDKVSGSKRSPDQVEIALNFLVDLVKCTDVNPADIVLLAPYAANVELIGRMRRKNPEYASTLAAMPPVSTVDSFQGKEGDIVVIVMGTTGPKPGPGFTCDEHRLCVLLTRQRCGLVIVGDINVTGALEDKNKGKAKGKGKGKGKAQERFLVEGADGQIAWVKATILRGLYKKIWQAGRVVRVDAKKQGQG